MLRRAINKNENEYEIQNSKICSELDFYNYFIDIKTIVTKEQFENIEYKVVE